MLLLISFPFDVCFKYNWHYSIIFKNALNRMQCYFWKEASTPALSTFLTWLTYSKNLGKKSMTASCYGNSFLFPYWIGTHWRQESCTLSILDIKKGREESSSSIFPPSASGVMEIIWNMTVLIWNPSGEIYFPMICSNKNYTLVL